MRKCKQCGKELERKVWYGKRRYRETNKRWNERQYCDNECRSKALSEIPKEENYFYGKSLIPWNYRKGNGWKHTDERGYIRLYKNHQSFLYEHRVVAEKKYGRLMEEDEVVHHINGNTSDNRPENLEIMNRSEHISMHAKRRWNESTVTPSAA